MTHDERARIDALMQAEAGPACKGCGSTAWALDERGVCSACADVEHEDARRVMPSPTSSSPDGASAPQPGFPVASPPTASPSAAAANPLPAGDRERPPIAVVRGAWPGCSEPLVADAMHLCSWPMCKERVAGPFTAVDVYCDKHARLIAEGERAAGEDGPARCEWPACAATATCTVEGDRVCEAHRDEAQRLIAETAADPRGMLRKLGPSPATAELPKPSGHGVPVQPLVIEDMRRRMQLGTERYGQPLKAFDGRDTLVDIYQELLDASVYVRKAIEERATPPAAEALDLIRKVLDCDDEDGVIGLVAGVEWQARARALLEHEAQREHHRMPGAIVDLLEADVRRLTEALEVSQAMRRREDKHGPWKDAALTALAHAGARVDVGTEPHAPRDVIAAVDKLIAHLDNDLADYKRGLDAATSWLATATSKARAAGDGRLLDEVDLLKSAVERVRAIAEVSPGLTDDAHTVWRASLVRSLALVVGRVVETLVFADVRAPTLALAEELHRLVNGDGRLV